jgi:DNA polymerase-1
VFIGADYSFVELCTLAQVCYELIGFSKLGDAINAGLDPHLDFAASILGITYAEAERRYAADDPQLIEMRQASKAANFGYPGGLGADSFREYARATYKVVLSKSEAEKLRAQFYTKWPEVGHFHKGIGKMSDRSHEFTIEQLYSKRKRAGCTFTSGANSFFQGLAADGAKLAGWEIMKECYLENPHDMPRPERVIGPIREAAERLRLRGPSPLYGSRPVVFAHDEVIAESREDEAPEAADRMAKVMIECMQIYTPRVKIRSEAVITRRWLKGAKPVRDVNGRLMVFEPKAKK